MYISRKQKENLFDTGYGEHIYKLAGPHFGELQKHSVVYVEIEPGKSNRKHYHPVVEETYYILSGEAHILLNDKTAPLLPGDLVAIPAGTIHKISNYSKYTMLCFLATCATPWYEDCSIFLE